MCGLAGFLNADGRPPDTAWLAAMLAPLAPRGPDGEGAWTDGAAGVALGHRRLAIVDLSPTGRQPMVSADGRWVLSFVGEVYDHPEVRSELESAGTRFRGTSDTEVLLEAVARWGAEAALARVNGMFAVALWDRARRELTLARDPLGIKPLYWGWMGQTLLFGSELKALRAHPAFRPAVDPAGLRSLLSLGYVGGPGSIFAGVQSLPPGTLASFRPGRPGLATLSTFWSLAQVATGPRLALDEDGAAAQLSAILGRAVGRQMQADVPVGAFLSGGMDSSAVAAAMQRHANRPIRTFTIGFEGMADERAAARSFARRLGTDHQELRLSAVEAAGLMPVLAEAYDEPLADPSALPTYAVSRLARGAVTVALSGDGGDELFGGYPRYAMALRLERLAARLPRLARRGAAAGLGAVPAPVWSALTPLLPRRLWRRSLADTVRVGAELLALDDPGARYARIQQVWPDPARALAEPWRRVDRDAAPRAPGAPDGLPFAERMRLADIGGYLPDDILAKVDRASMANSLEVRVPLLDRELVEFCWRLPHGLVDPTRPKRLLRRAAAPFLPEGGLDQGPKQGFSPPVGDWLRGPLRDWAESLLSERALRDAGLLDPATLRRTWADHLSRRQDHAQRLWAALSVQAWQRRWASENSPPLHGSLDIHRGPPLFPQRNS